MSDLHCPATVLLARHGEAVYEDSSRSDGGTLSAPGRAQAEQLASRLRDRNIAHVWTSQLSRAVQTAEIAASRLGVGVSTRAGLRELDDEPATAAKRRFVAAVEEIADRHRGETVLVISHGAIIRAAVPPLCGLPAAPAPLRTTGLVEVVVDGDGWRCRHWDLEPESTP